MHTIDDVPMDTIGPDEELITPDVMPQNLRALSSAVVIQAILDLDKKRQPERVKDAFLFITDPVEFEAWLDFAGMYFDVYSRLLPNLKQVIKRLKRR